MTTLAFVHVELKDIFGKVNKYAVSTRFHCVDTKSFYVKKKIPYFVPQPKVIYVFNEIWVNK